MRSNLHFVLAYLRLNLSAAVEYRAAFLAQVLGMMLNDLVFIIFWGLYFARFPAVGGWGIQDVALLWAVAGTSIGLSAALLGNCTRIATIIVQGQLDYYLGLPRDTLLHVLVSRSGLAGWGDVCFGLLAVFNGWIRVLIFTLVPAGFISHLPVELLRTFDPWRMAAVLGFTVLSMALALVVFRLGLRRYESGNLVVLRG